jgi:hypothetical protein
MFCFLTVDKTHQVENQDVVSNLEYTQSLEASLANCWIKDLSDQPANGLKLCGWRRKNCCGSDECGEPVNGVVELSHFNCMLEF